MCGLHGTTKTSLYRVFLMVGYGNRDVSVTLRASLLIRLTSNHQHEVCIYSSAPTSANKHKHSCWVCMKDPTVTPAVQMCHRGYLKSDTRGEFKAKFQKGAEVHWWPWQHSLTTSHFMVICSWWGVVCGSAEWEGWSSSLGVVSEEAGRRSWWASSNHTYINTNIVLLAKSHSKLYL